MNKSTIAALVLFTALVGAFVTLRQPRERGITRISFATVDPTKVTRVVVQGSEPADLRRENGAWKLDGKPADPTAIDRLLEAVARVESSDLATRSSERFADLEVDAEKGARVEVYTGTDRAAEFVVGKSGRGGSYVRVGDAAYLVKSVYRGSFARPRKGWLDLKLFADPPEAVTKAEVRLAGETPYALVKRDERWALEDESLLPAGHRFDASAAAALVRSLVSVRAADLPSEDPGSERTGLGESADRLVFHVGGEEKTRVLEIGAAKDDGTVYARASTREDLAELSSYSADALRLTVAELRDLRLMSFEPEAVKRLEIVDRDKRLVLDRTESEWKVAESSQDLGDGFAVDPQLVRRRLVSVAEIKATREAEGDLAAAKIDPPEARVALVLNDEQVVTLSFGQETKWEDRSVVVARGNADGRAYLVPTSARDGVLRGADSFEKSAQPAGLSGLDPEALKNLPPEVQEAIRKQMAEEAQKQKLLEAIQKQAPQAGSP